MVFMNQITKQKKPKQTDVLLAELIFQITWRLTMTSILLIAVRVSETLPTVFSQFIGLNIFQEQYYECLGPVSIRFNFALTNF